MTKYKNAKHAFVLNTDLGTITVSTDSWGGVELKYVPFNDNNLSEYDATFVHLGQKDTVKELGAALIELSSRTKKGSAK